MTFKLIKVKPEVWKQLKRSKSKGDTFSSMIEKRFKESGGFNVK